MTSHNAQNLNVLSKIFMEHYPFTANTRNFDFVTGCREFKRREDGDSDMKILQDIQLN